MRTVPFDMIADTYDRNRGGEGRADRFAEALSAHMPPGEGVHLEVGVGTGLVSRALVERGFHMLGLDVSTGMLRHAKRRLPDSIILADAQALPVRDCSVTSIVCVWSLHLVPDLPGVFREFRRVSLPKGVVLVIPASNRSPKDPIAEIMERMQSLLIERHQDEADTLVDEAARGVGLERKCDVKISQRYPLAPAQMVEQIRNRNFSTLRDLDLDDSWGCAMA